MDSEQNRGLGGIVRVGSYLVIPEFDALYWVELGVQVLWPACRDKGLGIRDCGFAIKIDLFEKVDLGHSSSIIPFVSSDRGALPEAFELGIVAPLHSSAPGVLCMKFGLMFAKVGPFVRPYASRAELGSARADSF